MGQGSTRSRALFVANGVVGCALAAAAFLFVWRDCGGAWGAMEKEPSFFGCAALAIASVAAAVGLSRLAAGAAAYIAIALGIYELMAGAIVTLSPVAHLGAVRLLLSVAMLAWGAYVIVVKRFLRRTAPEA